MNLLGRLRPGRAGPGLGSRQPRPGGGGRAWRCGEAGPGPAIATGPGRVQDTPANRPTPSSRCCRASTATPTAPARRRGQPDLRAPLRTPRRGHDRDVRRWISGTVHGRPAGACRCSPSSPTGRQGPRESCGQAAVQPPAHPSRPGAARAGGPREVPRFPDRVRRRDLFLAHRLTPRPAPPHRAAPPAPPRPAFGTPFGTERMSGGAAQRSTRLRPPGSHPVRSHRAGVSWCGCRSPCRGRR